MDLILWAVIIMQARFGEEEMPGIRLDWWIIWIW